MRKITVLVGLYRASRFLEAKIANLKLQNNFDDCNIILLNCQDLEKESTLYADFLQSNENVSEILFKQHIGLYATWNAGIEQSQSEYIVNANADDMWHPEYLERMIKALDEDSGAAVAYSHVKLTGQPNQFDASKWQYTGGLSTRPFPQGTMGPCPVWRRSLHDRFGLFPDYQVISDALMWQKWRRGGERFLQVPEPLVLYFQNPNSLERRLCPHSKLPLREVELRDIGAHHV